MMTPYLVAFLQNAPSVSAIVSSRIYPQILPQAPTLPALTYTVVSNVRTYDLVGDLHKAHARVQIDCWAATQVAVYQLADAVRRLMSGFYGSMEGIQVHFIILEDERDFFESQAGVTGLYRVSQDHRISHLED